VERSSDVATSRATLLCPRHGGLSSVRYTAVTEGMQHGERAHFYRSVGAKGVSGKRTTMMCDVGKTSSERAVASPARQAHPGAVLGPNFRQGLGSLGGVGKLPIAQQFRMGEVQPRPVMTPEAQVVLEQRVAAWAPPPKHHLGAPPAALSGKTQIPATQP
jgi:hypothetical protein